MAEATNSTELSVADKLNEIATLAYIAEAMIEDAIGEDPSQITGRRDLHYVTERQADATMWAIMALTNKIHDLQALVDRHEGREEVRQAA